MQEIYKQKIRSAFESQTADPLVSGMYILKGDVSGIQEYIFNVESKGAAKTLHEHSVNIMKVEEKYMNGLKAKLERNNLQFYKGGGGFHFILEKDATDDVENKLKDFQQKVNKELIHSPVSIRFSYGLGKDFKDTWRSLQKNNNEKRYLLYEEINEDPLKELFSPFIKDETSFENSLKEAKSTTPVIENQHWTKELIKIHKEQKGSNTEEAKIGNYIDFDGYASFAQARTGTDFLGILKMDVDNLGKLFGDCETKKEFTQLSSFFNEFFGKKNIEFLLSKRLEDDFEQEWTYHKNIYTIFAGGDDCFFIGAWDAILKFAEIIHSEFEKQIKEKFKKETSNKEVITLSAGIVLLDAKTPVVQLGKTAEDALSKAKSRKVENETVKNAVCIMDEIFTWNDYKGILEQTDTLVSFLNDGKISRGLLEKVKKSSIGFDALQGRIKKGKSLPFDRVYKLKYYLRDVKKEYAEEVEVELFKPYIEALTKALMLNSGNLYSEDFANPMRFPMAARLAEFKTRKNTKSNE
jgi:CRISPR-associated protein Csm1